MKYLKRFNEELSPRIYQSAARKLDMLGRKSGNQEFKNRANILNDYAGDRNWKNNIEEYSKFGKSSITIQYNKKGDVETGDFYLIFDFDSFSFEDQIQDYLDEDRVHFQFSVGLIPADEETRDKFIKVLPEGDFDNGFFWGFWVGVELEDNGSGKGLELKELFISSYDFSVSGKLSFNRSLCGSIKRHLSACFDENSGYKQDGIDMYKLLQDKVIIASGVSQQFGLTMSDLTEVIKQLTPNIIMGYVSDDQNW